MDNLEKLINEKFNGVNTRLDSIDGRLNKINGSVQRHEKQIGEALIERAANRQLQDNKFKVTDSHEARIDLLEKENISHILKCPVAPKVEKLQEDAITEKAMKKYNARLFVISTTVLGLIIAAIGLWIKLGG